MINIIYTKPSDMRYSTIGDYYDAIGGGEVYQVADLGSNDMNFLVAIHELIESHICRKRGIKEPDIMTWDLAHAESDDPGSEPGCIYGKEHKFAEKVEYMVMEELGISKESYEAALEAVIPLLPE
jgi:hypothetical protein